MRDEPTLDVPRSWEWASLDAVTELNPRFEAAIRRGNPNVSFVPMPAVEAGTGIVDVSRTRRLEEVRKGYTHFREGNGSMDQIGRVGMCHGELPVCGHQNHLIRVRVANGSDPRFVLLFLLSPQGRDLIVKEASSTSGLHTLSISKVSNLAVPATSLAEEAAVVAVVDEKLEEIDRTVEEIETQFTKSETLRQSILRKAFAGQLVTQDPRDEPASVLLKKIRAEREKAGNRSLTTKRTRKAETTT